MRDANAVWMFLHLKHSVKETEIWLPQRPFSLKNDPYLANFVLKFRNYLYSKTGQSSTYESDYTGKPDVSLCAMECKILKLYCYNVNFDA